jgi:glycine/D-amino acid oxidase-like deaminating enzyme
MPQSEKDPVVVVGAGIVGVCCALYLLRDGHSVVLIDRGAPGEGTSFGNGSIITEEAKGETDLAKATRDGVREPLNRRSEVVITVQ